MYKLAYIRLNDMVLIHKIIKSIKDNKDLHINYLNL